MTAVPTYEALIAQYREKFPFDTAKLEDPLYAQDLCHVFSVSFGEMVLASGITDTEVVFLVGCRQPFTNHSWDHEVDFSKYWHAVTRVGDVYVDWTIRQFDVTAPVPLVSTREELEVRWKEFKVDPVPLMDRSSSLAKPR